MIKMNTLIIIALVLIFLGGIGAILLAIGQSISSSRGKTEIITTTKDENQNLKNEINNLKKDRQELSNELQSRDSLLQERNTEIINLSHKLEEKSQYIQDYLTGSNGYPFLDFSQLAGEPNGLFKVIPISKFPIYNLTITVFDYEMLSKKIKEDQLSGRPLLSQADFNTSRILDLRIDELSPPQSWIIDKKIKLSEAKYFVQLRARNAVTIEKIATKVFNQTLYFGFQIFTIDGKFIEERFSLGIPEEAKKILHQVLDSIPSILSFDLTG